MALLMNVIFSLFWQAFTLNLRITKVSFHVSPYATSWNDYRLYVIVFALVKALYWYYLYPHIGIIFQTSIYTELTNIQQNIPRNLF